MNTFNKTPTLNHKHKFVSKTMWSPFQKRNGSYFREKFLIKQCIECKLEQRTLAEEWESFGTHLITNPLSNHFQDEQEKLAKKILLDLYKANNNKRWSSWKTNLLKLHNYESLDHVISTLNKLGILIIRYRKDKQRIDHTLMTHLYYNENFVTDIKNILHINELDVPFWVKDPFPKIEAPPTKLESKYIYEILSKQKEIFKSKNTAILQTETGRRIASSNDSRFSYFRLIRCLYGLLALIEDDRTETFRTFSQQLFHDTKLLTKQDVEKLKKLLGNSIVSSCLRNDFSEILISAKFSWEFNYHTGHSESFKHYIPLPRDMIYDMELLSWDAPNLLIIENQELFYNIIKQQFLDQNQWAILFSYGFLSSGEEQLIAKASKHRLDNIYIWPDLDPYGYEIAKNIEERFAHYKNLSVFLYGFSPYDFEKLPVYKKMTLRDIQKIHSLLEMDIHPVVRNTLLKMLESGNKGEQEILIKSINTETFESNLLNKSISILNR